MQVSFETGETIYTALNPATGQGYASVELYTNKIDPEDKTTLIRLYNDFKLSGVGRTSFFSTGWYKLTDLDMGDMASLQEDADPCTEAFPGVDCDEFGRISHLQVRICTSVHLSLLAAAHYVTGHPRVTLCFDASVLPSPTPSSVLRRPAG